MSELILLCRPEEIFAARSFGLRTACAGWIVGADSRLQRCAMPARGVDMMAVFGAAGKRCEMLSEDIGRECRRLGINEVLYFTAAAGQPRERGYRLYIPRSTAISGGDVRELLRGERAALVEPVREYFPLPAKSGGRPINEVQLESFRKAAVSSGFSEELGCKYLLSASGCVLYDDVESIARKLELLSCIGTEKIILPYMSGRVREFLHSRF